MWRAAVAESPLQFHVTAQTLLLGGAAGSLISAMVIWFALRSLVRRPARELLEQGAELEMEKPRRKLAGWIAAESCDGVLLDLGVSSHQLDVAERGFSFQQDGPLDMRMDQGQELTAAALLNEASVDELAEMFWKYGGEEQSRRVAREVAREREQRPFTRTRQLAGLMERISPRAGRKTHPATKVFLALRVAVNDELGSLRRGLEAAMKILKPGGRLAAITFHAVEDRVVKEFGRHLSRGYDVPGEVDVPELRRPRPAQARWVWRKALTPGEAELRDNPRSRSGQCRVLEKLRT